MAPAPATAAAPCSEEHLQESPTALGRKMHSTFVMLAPMILIGAGCMHAVIQEQLMHDLSHLPLLITSFEFGCCAVLSLLMLLVRRDDPFNAPRLSLLRISVLVLASLVSGNVALKWVSYPVKVCLRLRTTTAAQQHTHTRTRHRRAAPPPRPQSSTAAAAQRHTPHPRLTTHAAAAIHAAPHPLSQVVAKSCKLLPTMALGSLLLRKRYSRHDQLAALLLCAGLVGFTLADKGPGKSGSAKPSSMLGVAVLLFAVSCDAVQVLLSERMLRAAPHLTPAHVMMHTNGFAFVLVLAGMLATGEASLVPWSTLPWMRLIGYGACSWIGVCCFITLTRSWGATAAVRAHPPNRARAHRPALAPAALGNRSCRRRTH